MEKSTKWIESVQSDSEIEEMFKILKGIKFFKDNKIEGEDLHIVEQGLIFEEMDKDDFVFHYGSLGDKFYIILEGSVKILRPLKTKPAEDKVKKLSDKDQDGSNKKLENTSVFITDDCDSDMEYQELVTLHKGQSFGELALMNNKPRAATIRWAEPTKFAVLNKLDYQKVFAKIDKKKLNDKIAFLKWVPYLSKWTNMALGKFGYHNEVKEYIRNQPVFKEGQKCENVYIVKSGEFELSKSKWIQLII